MKISWTLYKPSLVILIASVTLVSGCVGLSGVPVRASDSMFQENSVEKIAILSAGRVEWPRWARKEPVLGLAESKQSLAMITPKLREILVDKGYEIVFSEPVGIGYYSPFYKENWVIKNYGEKDGEIEKLQVADNGPAFEYPVVQDNQEFRKAVRNIFEQIELALYRRDLNIVSLSKNDLEVIRQVTGGDTIFFFRVWGRRFSTQRKVATAFRYPPHHSDRDWGSYLLFFVNASSGEVLWEGVCVGKDPSVPEKTGVMEILRYFPRINQTMDTKWKKDLASPTSWSPK